MIKRKILEKVVTFTTSSEFDEDDDEANDSVADSADRDIVIANGSDSSDGKVMAASIDSEDGLVDITMKEINGAPDSVEVDASKSSEPGLRKRNRTFAFIL
jgi:ubiquitin carboxyl-terminal hydrolase 4/11/15